MNTKEYIQDDPFKEYDIRGLFPDIINDSFSYYLGRTISLQLKSRNLSAIIIGRDNRLSSNNLLISLQAGLINNGINVLNLGEVTSPMLYFSTFFYGIGSGIMVTGSHNPPEYNGFKIIIDWKTLYGEDIRKLKSNFSLSPLKTRKITSSKGKINYISVKDNYINRVTKDIKLHRPIKIVLDCGNGTASLIAPDIFKKLGCNTIDLYCKSDGTFPNHHPDPSDPKNLIDLIKCVKENNYELGFAFDGDGDRIGIVNNDGNIILPDQQLSIFVSDILKKFPCSNIIYDVKCGRNLEKNIMKLGGNPVMHRSGHSPIKDTMQKINSMLAGEMSGHIFFRDNWYGFDDGIYAGARFLEIVSRYNDINILLENNINKIFTIEMKIPMQIKESKIIINKLKSYGNFGKYNKLLYIEGIRVEYEKGFGLIKASNTTPHMLLKFEADDEDTLKHIKNIFLQQLQKYSYNT